MNDEVVTEVTNSDEVIHHVLTQNRHGGNSHWVPFKFDFADMEFEENYEISY